ncbi:MAG TPA: PASTA domain-containing protein, partial [Pyrinomonadaceae bacterium]|nr:PASTA domain-containing protein [Pyrinomonadaceae bacterium]
AEQILPDLGIPPDTQLKPSQQISEPLVAQATQGAAVVSQPSAGPQREEQALNATLPEVTQAGRDGEIVYAVSTRNAMVMPDLRGRSVRDVARTCAQLGLQVEARGEGRVWRQSPAPGAEVTNRQVVRADFGRVE